MKFKLEQAVGQATEAATALCTTPQLETLIMKAGLQRFQPPPRRDGAQRYWKPELVSSTTQSALTAAYKGNSAAVEGLTEFVRLVAARSTGHQFEEILEATRAAGFDLLVVEGTTRLLPLDEPASPLSRASTALEASFDQLGLTTAKAHYRQAIESLVDSRPEAANGQMRSMLEEVIIQVAIANGFNRTRQGEGGKALKHLIDITGALPSNDGGDYIRGLWSITHTNGPHPGTSPSGEAHFRVQAMTSAARYLIDRFLS